MIKRMAGVLAVLLGASLPALAGDCGYSGGHGAGAGTYGATVHHRETPPTVATAHTYDTILLAQPLILPIEMPTAAFVNLAPPTVPPAVTIAPSMLQQVQQRADTAEARVRQSQEERLARIERALEKLADTRRTDPELPPPARLPGEPTARAEPPSSTAPADPNERPPAAAPPLSAVAAVLSQHCAQCHSGRAARGDVQLFDETGAFAVAGTTPAEIAAAVSKNDARTGLPRMPKGPVKLVARDKELVAAWATASR